MGSVGYFTVGSQVTLSRNIPDLSVQAFSVPGGPQVMTPEDETPLANKLESLVQIHSCLSIFARLGARPVNTEVSVGLRTSLLWAISRDQSQTINCTECSGQQNGPAPRDL